ncbi:MAG: hypothetical protein NXI24_10710 [bacterium]|nr:hypothetical protein [bacterium]
MLPSNLFIITNSYYNATLLLSLLEATALIPDMELAKADAAEMIRLSDEIERPTSYYCEYILRKADIYLILNIHKKSASELAIRLYGEERLRAEVFEIRDSNPAVLKDIVNDVLEQERRWDLSNWRRKIWEIMKAVPEESAGDFNDPQYNTQYKTATRALYEIISSPDVEAEIDINELVWEVGYHKGYAFPPDIFRKMGKI